MVSDVSVLALFLTDFHFSLLFYEFFWRLMGINKQAISGAMVLFFTLDAFYTGWWGVFFFLLCYWNQNRMFSKWKFAEHFVINKKKKRKRVWKTGRRAEWTALHCPWILFFLASLMSASPGKLFLRGSHMVELLACYPFPFISFWPVPQSFTIRFICVTSNHCTAAASFSLLIRSKFDKSLSYLSLSL